MTTRISRALSLLTGLLGAVVLIGEWFLDIAVLRTALPHLEARLARTTAFSFIALSTCLYLRTLRPRGRFLLWPAFCLIGLVIVIAILNLRLIAVGRVRGLDELLFGFTTAKKPIYMSPATAIDFLIASICMAALFTSSIPHRLFTVLATFGLVTALIALAGYAYDAAALYEVSLFTAMSVHTALGFVWLFLGLLFVEPDRSWLATIVGEGQGSIATRRLLPAILGAPFLLGWMALFAMRENVLSLTFSISLLVIVVMTILTAPLIRNGMLQNADSVALRETNAQLQRTIDHRNLLLKEVYHRTKNNLQLVQSILILEAKTHDGDIDKLIQRVSDRIQALGLSHAMLLHDSDAYQLDIQAFLGKLVNHMKDVASTRLLDIEVPGYRRQFTARHRPRNTPGIDY